MRSRSTPSKGTVWRGSDSVVTIVHSLKQTQQRSAFLLLAEGLATGCLCHLMEHPRNRGVLHGERYTSVFGASDSRKIIRNPPICRACQSLGDTVLIDIHLPRVESVENHLGVAGMVAAGNERENPSCIAKSGNAGLRNQINGVRKIEQDVFDGPAGRARIDNHKRKFLTQNSEQAFRGTGQKRK